MSDTGVLVANLGTPDAPTPAAVRRFLAEFLWDRRVVDLPRLPWWLLLNGVVLPFRPRKSARAYREIWTDAGSPLMTGTQAVVAALAERLGAQASPAPAVAMGMTYGHPSIAAALAPLRTAGLRRLIVLPLYPQYSRATTESVRDRLPHGMRMIESFHDDRRYIGALAQSVQRHWESHGRAEMFIMSFHGLPKRSVERGDPYEKQCRETARLLGAALGLTDAQWKLTFQSRFGAAKWLEPYTLPTLVELAMSGLRKVDVICPGFVSDCLETLEEIGIEGRRAFLAAGGAQFSLIPCLNESIEWIQAAAAIVRENLAH